MEDNKSQNNTTKASESPQTPVENSHTPIDETFEYKPVMNQVNPKDARIKFL